MQPSKRRPGVSLPGSVAKLLRETPLRKFTPDERSIIWRHRDALVHVPGVRAALDTRAARAAIGVSHALCCCATRQALPKLLRCVNWANRDVVHEAHQMLPQWGTISVTDAMLLLDLTFPDPYVRRPAPRPPVTPLISRRMYRALAPVPDPPPLPCACSIPTSGPGVRRAVA